MQIKLRIISLEKTLQFLPDSAIKKIEHRIPSNLNQDDVLSYIKQYKLYNENTLIEYEKQKIIDNI